jgi:DNA-binding NarL/FixJ family response regulator
MTEPQDIRLLVADDYEMIREGVKSLLSGTGIRVAVEAASGPAAVQAALENDIDMVLLDIRMDHGDGLAALECIRRDKPDLPVLMFTHFDNLRYAAQAVALGASGYLLKGCTRAALIQAIRSAASGEKLWTHNEHRRIGGAMAACRIAIDLEVPLTQRENEVLRQLATGATTEQIARKMHIGSETVKEHIHRTLHKLGVADRTQAAVWALRKGLV